MVIIVDGMLFCSRHFQHFHECKGRRHGISAPEIPGLTFESEMQNDFAECFHIYYYNDDYTLIDVPDSGQFLLVPEGKTAPDGLDSDIVVLQKPLDNIYLAATSAMSLFSSLDALDNIKFSSLQESGWYVEAAKQAMEDGSIVFAGKYSEPGLRAACKFRL